MKEFLIEDATADTRLDRYLRREVPGLTQGILQKLLRAGKIRLNGARAEANTRLKSGDVLLVPDIAPPAERPKERHIVKMDPERLKLLKAMVIYEDDTLIALNKPAGIAVQGGNNITVHIDGMLDALQGDSPERPKLVHRIDRDTSGVLLIAKSAKMATKLTAAFKGREIQKTYWALLAGVPEPFQGRIDLPLKRIELGQTSRAEPASRKDEDAQKAITDYRVLDRASMKFALVELNPHTGRMHQLRAHCLALGTPIMGDEVYGGVFADPFAQQLHLHARKITIPHPQGGHLTIEADLPDHMRASFKYLGFDTPPAAKPVRSR
jgi:23S rRNA pseudouridine955/2504/2580 synthase